MSSELASKLGWEFLLAGSNTVGVHARNDDSLFPLVESSLLESSRAAGCVRYGC